MPCAPLRVKAVGKKIEGNFCDEGHTAMTLTSATLCERLDKVNFMCGRHAALTSAILYAERVGASASRGVC